MFHIYIPMGNYGDSLFVRSAEIRSTYYDDVINGELWFDVAPEVTTSILQNLYPLLVATMANTSFGTLHRAAMKAVKWTFT